jgi:IS30 family transposase
MDQKYKQLSLAERETIYLLNNNGLSAREIAFRLNRHHSSISRELKRNKSRIGYLPDTAQKQYVSRRWRGFKLERNTLLRSHIFDHLQLGWNPEIIAAKLREAGKKGCNYACSETIYNYLYNSQFARKHQLYQLLAKQKPRRKRGRTKISRSRIPERVPIHKRPKSAMNRSRYGHWEGDLILFSKQKENIIVLAERKSRMIKAQINQSKQKDITMQGVSTITDSLPNKFCRTVTFDNGGEFANHMELNKKGIKTYFCDPYSSWQKGTVENCNGILRRFLPKCTDISRLSQKSLDIIVDFINNIPRKSLGYKSPAEIFNRRTSN